mmetsp:Transcript_28445/g.53227  ORF Transcript_28445/g.53227 Transcript_28445/m.53227 type:complete len:231 (-) Transcript_28445:78-770(-)
MNGAWFGVDKQKKRIVVCAPIEYRKGNKLLLLAPKFYRHGRMAKTSYEKCFVALQHAVDEGFKTFAVPTRFYTEHRNKDGQSNRIWEYSDELHLVRLKRSGKKYWALPNDLSNRVAKAETTKAEFKEGKVFSVILRGKERSASARQEAIRIHGHACKVCKMIFENRYGSLGQGFIHVHHLYPMKNDGGERNVDPETDLVPLCPNCHAMIHRKEPPITIERLIEIYEGNED